MNSALARAGRAAILCVALGAAMSLPVLTARAAEDLPYLFDQLKKPRYKASLDAILKGQRNLPPWIARFMKTSDGVANLGSTVMTEGQPLELYSVCKPHDCDTDTLYVLYAPGGTRAWALITSEGAKPAVLGNPNPAQRKVLEGAIGR